MLQSEGMPNHIYLTVYTPMHATTVLQGILQQVQEIHIDDLQETKLYERFRKAYGE